MLLLLLLSVTLAINLKGLLSGVVLAATLLSKGNQVPGYPSAQ
ncbi:hypothetical protein [Hymenobacter saemangeumensis]